MKIRMHTHALALLRGAAFAAALLALSAASAAPGAGEAATNAPLRVAFCTTPGLFERDMQGKRSGQLVTLVERIAAKLGRPVEWVDTTPLESVRLIGEGKLDFVGGVPIIPELHGHVHYSHMPIAFMRPALRSLSSAFPYDGRNLSTLDGAMIGVLKYMGRTNRQLAEYLEAAGAKCDFRGYDDITSLERALFTGEVDAAITDAVSSMSGGTTLLQLPTVPLYFVSSSAKPGFYVEMDNLLPAVFDEDPSLWRRMQNSMSTYEETHPLIFTAEERAWIAARIASGREIVLDISEAVPPYCDYDPRSSKPNGFLGEVIDEISFRTGLGFKAVLPGSHRLGVSRLSSGDTDVWIPSDGSLIPEFDAAKWRLSFGMRVPQAFCTRRHASWNEYGDHGLVAVWSGDNGRLRNLGRASRLFDTIICMTPEECVKALMDGRADSLCLPYPMVHSVLESMSFVDHVDIHLDRAISEDFTLPVYVDRGKNPLLASILEKALASIPQERLVELTSRADLRASRRPPFLTRTQAIILICMVVALAAIAMSVVSLSSKYSLNLMLERTNAALQEAEEARAAMNDALDQAEAAARARSTFLATMSHEIRTPLNAVTGFAEFLQDPNCTDADRRRYTDGIVDSSKALLALINNILDLAKLEAGKLDVRGGRCDLHNLFKEMQSIFAFSLKGKNKDIALVPSIAHDVPLFALHEERIGQILLNLIGNAVKFTFTGSVSYSAAWRWNPDGRTGTLELRVKDTGVGIPPDRLESIFDPFEQCDDIRGRNVYKGTGLGLPICRKLAECAGGTVTVTSEIGAGSEFVVTIPDVEAIDASTPKPEAPASAGPLGLPPNLHVVIVDDMKLNRIVLEKHLSLIGVAEKNIHSFADPREVQEALTKILAQREDGAPPKAVLLTDIWMPEMSGETLARRIRADKSLAGVPIVAVTADANPSESFDTTLFTSILLKPIDRAKLGNLLASLS